MKKIIAATLALTACTPAYAQAPFCLEYHALIEMAKEAHGEVPDGRGLSAEGALIELLVNPETQEWTIIVVLPDGTACVGIHGHHWEHVMTGQSH
jgi:hypothetical protein